MLSGLYFVCICALAAVVSAQDCPTDFDIPDIPQLVSATFSSDGSSITVEFDAEVSASSVIGATSSFSCGILFLFPGASLSATCQFTSGKIAVVYLNGASFVKVNDFFAVRGGTISAKCPADYPPCFCSAFETVPDQSVLVIAPVVRASPVVVLPSAISASVCAAPKIDLSMSFGSGGRVWESATVTVTTASATGPDLKAFLEASAWLTTAVNIESDSVTLLESGFTYAIEIELCNFLGGCSRGTTVISVQDDPLPYVTILGSSVTSVNVFDTLRLSASAILPLCDSSLVPVSQLSFVWSVTLDDVPVVVNQVSRDKTRFNLPGYSLISGKQYRVICTVTNSLQSTQTSSASVLVTVAPGSVAAAVVGESSRLLPFASPISIDGSGSFDQNIGAGFNTNLQFAWTCQQTAPSALSSCPTLSLDSSRRGYLTIANTAGIYAPYGYTITMTVSDSANNNRSASRSVVVGLLAPAAPLVVVTNPGSSNKVNPTVSLRLGGVVELSSVETATWSVDDTLLQAELLDGSVLLTPRTFQLAAGRHSIALVLKPNVLTRGTTYVFTLSCSSTRASITILVNDPPRPGMFVVGTGGSTTGTEMTDPFDFATNFWTDVDTPIEFEFGFISNGVRLVLQPRSRSTSLRTTLPAGRDTDGYKLQTYVRVFDALDAVEETTFDVVVNKAVDTDDLLDTLEGSVSSAGTVSTIKAAVSLVTSVINRRECSNAPDCAELNRDSCGSTKNTCGDCLDGFYGDSGDHNTICITAADFSDVLRADEVSCNDCPYWHVCDTGLCVPVSKECPNECSGSNGECIFVQPSTGFTLASCPIYDFSCSATCACNSGFYGTDCSVTELQLAQRGSLRSDVIFGLQGVVDSDNPSADSALSMIASLSAATDQVSEISSDAANTVLTVANEILNGGQLGRLSADQISGLLSAFNSVLISSGLSAPGRRKLNVASMRKSVIESLDNYGLVIGDSHLVASQDSHFVETSSFRTAAQVFGAGSAVLGSLASSLESASGSASTTVSLNASESDSELLLIVTSIGRELYTDIDRPMVSAGIRATASGANVSKIFTFNIQHNGHVEFPVNKTGIFFKTECRGDEQVVDFVCPDNYVITHHCDGVKEGILLSECPGRQIVSICQNLEDAADVDACEVTGFTATSTTCKCVMRPSARRRARRGLQETEDIGHLEIAAMTTEVAEDFAGTLYEAQNFDSAADLQRVLTVIIMFGIMWVVGLGLTWYFAVRGATKDRKVELNEQLDLQRKMAAASSKTSVDKIKKYLDDYVNEVFPVVFRPSPWQHRLALEIKKHHRYINIFTSGGDPRVRLMVTVHLLTVQTMLMFILAVFYDIQFPTDDGSCVDLNSASCEDEKSMFDQEKSKCHWDSVNGECSYVEAHISEQLIVLISIIVAMCTAPINLVVDFLFDDILSAPTADAVKMSAEPNAIQKAGKQLNAARRASVSAIRRASVSLQSAVGPSRRESKRIAQTQTTLVIPESTISAQSLANASVSDALGIFKESQQKYEEERNSILGNTTSKSLINVSRRTRVGGGATQARGPVPVNTVAVPQNGLFGSNVDVRFAELSKEIIAQRRRLKPSEQEDFDARWGFDPNGEFSHDSPLSLMCCKKNGPEATIKKELEFVRKETDNKYEKLRLASDAHAGLELLHLFVLDLLGRDTPAARIFSSKTSEDFRHAMILSKWTKVVAWVVIGLMNFFFVFFAMLRGMERGGKWQKGYAVACLIQFAVEILMFETIECIWVHYLIPDAASAEIYAAQHSLKRTINSLCSTMSSSATYILDSPKYLFVSTNVAEKFPDMLESMIIRSYHHHLPGEMGKKWNVTNDRDSVIMRFIRNFSIFAITITVLQWVGSSPASLQRLVIHTANPLLFGAIFIFVMFLYRNPVYFSVIAALVLYKVLQYAWRHYMKRRIEDRPKKFDRMISNVVPVPGNADGSASRGSSGGSVRSITGIAVVPLPAIDKSEIREDVQASASANEASNNGSESDDHSQHVSDEDN